MTTLAIHEFLLCSTPQKWIDQALANPDILLIDHANCEKKAASTALNLMYRYVDDFELLNKMSRLAREELRHFEQVIAIMKKRGIEYAPLNASRYAAALRKEVRTYEPARLIDTLIIGAIIEARSCERFETLAPYLDDELRVFYESLLKSESRHFNDYLKLAKKHAQDDIEARTKYLLEVEQKLIESEDEEFRFHSGV
jgi:tRNA-(ms[2]io[6]A)-hydroxylase